MPRSRHADLLAFIAVARERSFTRAAAQLGVSQSALSHQMRALEARMGMRLLTRTTRSVAPTEAGDRLLRGVAPRFDEIAAELAAVSELRDEAAGNVRITATENAVELVLWPCLERLLPRYPQIKVELTVESRWTDIVAERYDMGVRMGGDVARDMVGVRIGPDLRFAIVAAPSYLARHTAPATPQELSEHACINLRLMSHGGLYAWELRKGRQSVNVRVEGQLVFNGPRQILAAATAGFGLAYLPLEMVRPHVASGRLRVVMADWCPAFTGYHAYYPSRREPSRAMAVLLDALRDRAAGTAMEGTDGA